MDTFTPHQIREQRLQKLASSSSSSSTVPSAAAAAKPHPPTATNPPTSKPYAQITKPRTQTPPKQAPPPPQPSKQLPETLTDDEILPHLTQQNPLLQLFTLLAAHPNDTTLQNWITTLLPHHPNPLPRLLAQNIITPSLCQKYLSADLFSVTQIPQTLTPAVLGLLPILASIITNAPTPEFRSISHLLSIDVFLSPVSPTERDMLWSATAGVVKDCARQGRAETTSQIGSVLDRCWDRAGEWRREGGEEGKQKGESETWNAAGMAAELVRPIANKLHLINKEFFRSQTLFNVKNQTRVHMSEKEAEAWTHIQPAEAPQFNFATEIFHLGILALHLGPCSSIRSWMSNNKAIQHYETQLPLVPPHIRGRVEAKMEQLKEYKTLLESVLFWKESVSKFSDVWDMAMEWMTAIWGGNAAPQHPNEYLASLPEYYVEAPLDFYLFYLGHRPDLTYGRSHRRVIEFSINFLTHPDYSKNPQIKSKSVELLYIVAQNFGSYIGTTYRTELFTNQLASDMLVASITSFYVSAESTGAHSQFYDKFNIRYRISYIMKLCWADELYRSRIKKEASNTTQFVRFVNMLNNDTTYLLDESLSKLVLIRALQEEMANESFSKLAKNVQEEKEKNLSDYERQCQSYMQLAVATVEMIAYLTSEIVDAFLVPEIVDRFAAMLNVNLKQLAGPRCQELKVKNADKYHFNPKQLLYSLLNIYLNLSVKRLFAEAIARDSRSYSKELFLNAANIMSRTGLMSEPNTKRICDFAELCETVIKEDQQDEEQLGDIPDEFLDPLMYTLMKDPVMLPSGTSIDRATITSHLLSDATDPFNRKPLKIEEVHSDVELKQKIEAWLASKRS